MKGYLLDTNICIFYMRGKYHLCEKIKKVGERNCYISEITVAELLYGAACSMNKEKHKMQVNEFIEHFKLFPIYNVLPTFAENKAALRVQGELIDDFDLLIGTTAVYHDMIMVTENVKHLARIPGIRIENWIER